MTAQYDIHYEYLAIEKQIHHLESEAECMRQQIDSFNQSIEQIHKAWSGDNAQIFLEKLKRNKQEMNATLQKILSVKAVLADVLTRLEKQELAAGSGNAGGGGSSW